MCNPTGTGSVFGALILNTNGTYRLTVAGETRRWRYDPATGALTFTGEFAASTVRYHYRVDALRI